MTISYAQLLDVCPKIRAELKNLKLDKNNPKAGLVHRGRIATSKYKMLEVPSKEYFDKLQKKKKKKTGTNWYYLLLYIQVLSGTDSTPGLIYKFPITIGSYILRTSR